MCLKQYVRENKKFVLGGGKVHSLLDLIYLYKTKTFHIF